MTATPPTFGLATPPPRDQATGWDYWRRTLARLHVGTGTDTRPVVARNRGKAQLPPTPDWVVERCIGQGTHRSRFTSAAATW
ncbi:hypothetical protein ACFXPY_46980 [Streptomyces sp. NPDC059153]|uniref:hypothetical protein n=1 Tax=Streptomyces sp. NPDC059153 TaxID=3346743 RepID=UPI0036AB33C0